MGAGPGAQNINRQPMCLPYVLAYTRVELPGYGSCRPQVITSGFSGLGHPAALLAGRATATGGCRCIIIRAFAGPALECARFRWHVPPQRLYSERRATSAPTFFQCNQAGALIAYIRGTLMAFMNNHDMYVCPISLISASIHPP